MGDQDAGPPPVVGELARKIDGVLSPLLPPGTSCALLDFPDHANVGDSAIWLGETRWLARRGVEVVYACDVAGYSRDRLAARLGQGVILLHGGGNLGDFWVEHQQFRERVVRDFPGHRIVQLPQTIYFLDAWGVGEARRAFDAHRGLTLLCRDRQSLAFARSEFRAPSLLCPDMAFALGGLERPGPPEYDVLWLRRTDAESQGDAPPPLPPGVAAVDWLEEPPTPLRGRYQSLLRGSDAAPDGGRAFAASVAAARDALAGERLRRGCGTLGRGRVVVTDRLHGHILSLLLGTPHVLLDNNYGKLSSFYQTWTGNCPLAHWADSPAEALTLARRLAGGAA